MFFDLEKGEPPQGDFDICIMGAGAAGITIAQKFENSNKRVLLLEGGGLSYSADSQELYDCKNTGLNIWPKLTRLRYFGGTSNHWSGRCRLFESLDFEERVYDSLPGWPIKYSEIHPYLRETMEILDLPTEGFKPINDDFLGSSFVPDSFAFSSPTRFGQKYYDLINESENIIAVINANVVDLDIYKSNITEVSVANYRGDNYRFTSSQFILAMGGIENARFLLNLNLNEHLDPYNSHSMIGRCFMEHLNVKLGEYILTDTDLKQSFQFYTSNSFQKENKTGGGNTSFNVLDTVRSYGRTAKIKTFLKTVACDLGLEEKVQFISNFDCPGTGKITTLIEQSPSLNSRIELSDLSDSTGLRQAMIHWEINDLDKSTIKAIGIELAKSFADSGVGLIKLENYLLDKNANIPVSHHAHHMGTTRMAESIEFGVVDKNCRVFGTENLYIAGSSIFSTGGACNPTMPLIQFALRLANHIKQKLN